MGQRMSSKRRITLPAVTVLLVLAGCSHVEPIAPRTAADPRVHTLDLGISNAHIVMGARPILVDTGSAGSIGKLEAKLAEHGVKVTDLALIVLTHGHADHAGGAKRLHELSGAPVVSHAGDVEMLQGGRNRPLKPMGLLARIIKPFVDDPFPPLTPDILVEGELDLRPYGVEGVVRSLPGHTPGSLAVVLPGGHAVVGDLVAGNPANAGAPMRHYFHDDCAAAEAHVEALVQAGTRTLHVGHGGPLDGREAVKALKASPCPR